MRKNIVKITGWTVADEGIYEPMININGKNYSCPCLTSENKFADFAGAVEELKDALVAWCEGKESFRIAFYACGNNMQEQQKLVKYFKEKYEIDVF